MFYLRSPVVVETPQNMAEQAPSILGFSSNINRVVGDTLQLDCRVSIQHFS
jgi:hypothetical protein